MKIIKDYDQNQFKHFTVISNDKEYKVDCLDNRWMCSCAIENNRSINTNCKHINEVKQSGYV